MTRFDGTDNFQAAEFIDVDMSGAVFREVDLSDARMYGVLLTGADIDGDLTGLRLNGVEVAPLVKAELDRLHPERTKLRPTTPEGMREALDVVKAIWAETDKRARGLTVAQLHQSVNNEWSYVDTLRHLVFVVDVWFGKSVQGEQHPFHPLGLPAAFITDGAAFGIDTEANPTLDEVLLAREDRFGKIEAFLATITQEDLDRVREPNHAPGPPPPKPRTAKACLHVVFNEEWTHHQFAIRDLAIIESS